MQKKILTALFRKNSEAGFALIAAIMACLILLALGMLVISLSTQDIRVSTKIVGEKRALAAADTGIVNLLQTFDPQSTTCAQNPTCRNDRTPVTRADGVSSYTIMYPATRPTRGPPTVPMLSGGYSIALGAQAPSYQSRYNIDVVGTNTKYNTRVTIGVGVGYGPVSGGTTY